MAGSAGILCFRSRKTIVTHFSSMRWFPLLALSALLGTAQDRDLTYEPRNERRIALVVGNNAYLHADLVKSVPVAKPEPPGEG